MLYLAACSGVKLEVESVMILIRTLIIEDGKIKVFVFFYETFRYSLLMFSCEKKDSSLVESSYSGYGLGPNSCNR